MSKIFRLYKEGAMTYKGWNENPAFPYNSNARETIADPDGASAKNEITSIPSPFARIDLVKTAFKEVCRRANGNLRELDGNTIFHKMVSDTFDVGEIFFNIDKLNDKVEIITCDCSAILQNLKSDCNPSHYYVADSLEKFLVSDAKTYNFDQMHNIYLLNYAKGPDELNIIGATSPATLFFCGANKLDYINDIYFSNNDKPFDNEYQPLYKRDFEYLKVWWTLRITNPNFSTLFPEIEDYLNLTFRALTDAVKKNQLKSITSQTLSDFSTIDVKCNGQSNQVEVVGINLLKKKSGITNSTSEFAIKTDHNLEEKPLVLPVESGNKYASLAYINGAWGKTNKAAYTDNNSLQDRQLPFDGSQFPYLTISDFLEDSIVRIPHSLNADKYFDGNITDNKENKSYLLPIKPLYFRYFDIDTLKSKMPDGKAALEMDIVAGGSVNVMLRIPIVGNGQINYIEYQRLYYADRQPCVDESTNEGGMTDVEFSGFVMPGVKFQQEDDAYYTISCISTFNTQAKLQFYKNGDVLSGIPMDCRNRQRGISDYKAESYTLSQTNFDLMRVVCGNGQCGIIIPQFSQHQGLDSFEFAVDLGTSNTHIEMKKNGNNGSVPFSYNEDDGIMCKFFTPYYRNIDGKLISFDTILDDENDVVNADFVPPVVGGKSDFKFPTRTALSCAKCIDWDEVLRVFGLLNFCMTYDKRRGLAYNSEPLVNIKWSNDSNSQSAMKLYIENLLLLIRNKVVVENGNLSETKIIWFYPSSMSQRRLTQLRSAWKEAFSKLFAASGSIIEESESEAPIQYYFSRYATATNLINIDIGGGTTDVAFSDGGEVKLITSFRFAANSLFEDSFSNINPNNGIIDWFKHDIFELLSTKVQNSELAVIYKRNDGHPANMASFFFSLKDNSATSKIANSIIDFNAILQNDDKFKIVFIIFYTAIIYHVAQIVKAKGRNVPRHIAFSGNGSKIVNVLTPDTRILADYTKIVFEKILDKPYGIPLEILGLDTANPKEATCKGGLLPIKQQTTPEKVTLKDASGALVESDTYASLDDKARHQTVNTIEQFFNFVLDEMPSAFNFDDNFGVSLESIALAKEECLKDLATYLDKGIEISMKESGNKENKIEDTISFYPIKGAIQALSAKVEEYFRNNA